MTLMSRHGGKLPVCCRQEMAVNLDLGRFLELKCGRCSDVVYVKRHSDAIRMDVLSQALK